MRVRLRGRMRVGRRMRVGAKDEGRMKRKARKLSQQGRSHDVSPKSSEPSQAIGNETAGNEGEDKSSAREDDKRAEAQDDNGSSRDEAKREESQSVDVARELDNVPEGVASDFLRFLINFRDDGCSEPYFNGILAAFNSHRPLFYVPYDFIVAHDELLALKIQDNYTRISEDLKISVVSYLSMNGVYFPDAVLKIIGLPEPKSYIDKPNGILEDAATGDMLQRLVGSVSDGETTGYVRTEVSIYSESLHRSVIVSDADFIQLQTLLNDNNFKFELADDGRLRCGSIILWKRVCPTEESDSHTVIVVEGPYSVEHDSVARLVMSHRF